MNEPPVMNATERKSARLALGEPSEAPEASRSIDGLGMAIIVVFGLIIVVALIVAAVAEMR